MRSESDVEDIPRTPARARSTFRANEVSLRRPTKLGDWTHLLAATLAAGAALRTCLAVTRFCSREDDDRRDLRLRFRAGPAVSSRFDFARHLGSLRDPAIPGTLRCSRHSRPPALFVGGDARRHA
jgi:hypothetical protein